MATAVRPTVLTLPIRRTPRPEHPLTPAWLPALRRFWQDDAGQDVIEYGLLAAFIGIVAIATWTSIQDHLRDAYLGYDADVQNLWQPPNPGGGS